MLHRKPETLASRVLIKLLKSVPGGIIIFDNISCTSALCSLFTRGGAKGDRCAGVSLTQHSGGGTVAQSLSGDCDDVGALSLHSHWLLVRWVLLQ